MTNIENYCDRELTDLQEICREIRIKTACIPLKEISEIAICTLVYRNSIISKEIRTLRTQCYLLTIWGGKMIERYDHTLAALQTMKKDIEELKKKPKTIY